MILLYLKFKAFSVMYREQIRRFAVFPSCVLIILYGCLVVLNTMNKVNENPVLFICFICLTIFVIFLACVLSLDITDLQKKILCTHLKTKYSRCNELIDILMNIARKRKNFHFEYGVTLFVGMDNTIDEPYIVSITDSKGDQIAEYSSSLHNMLIYKSENRINQLLFKEFLIGIIEYEEDYIRLEKLILQIGC